MAKATIKVGKNHFSAGGKPLYEVWYQGRFIEAFVTRGEAQKKVKAIRESDKHMERFKF